jgi:Uma2 family endonuclease
MAITEQRMTLEAFLELPEKKPALEFEDGMVTQKVPPQGKHSWLQYAIADRFNALTVPGKIARAFPELRATFAGVSRVPDVAVYRWERIPRDADGRVADEFREPPDIAIEIISPGQRPNALVRRCLWYVAHGVGAALLVDPYDETILLFRPDRTPFHLQGEEQIDLSDLVPGLQLTVQQIFESLLL